LFAVNLPHWIHCCILTQQQANGLEIQRKEDNPMGWLWLPASTTSSHILLKWMWDGSTLEHPPLLTGYKVLYWYVAWYWYVASSTINKQCHHETMENQIVNPYARKRKVESSKVFE
jgi:hypothetical protein